MILVIAGYVPNLLLKANSFLPTQSTWEEKATLTITSRYPVKSITFTSTILGSNRIKGMCPSYNHVLLTFNATTNTNSKTFGYYCYSLKYKRATVRLKHL